MAGALVIDQASPANAAPTCEVADRCPTVLAPSVPNAYVGQVDQLGGVVAKTVNLYDAKTQLSQLVEDAAAGEEIIIAKAGKPRARLVPLASRRPLRAPGGWTGQVWISEDFDDPLPPDELGAWYRDDVTDDNGGNNSGEDGDDRGDDFSRR